MDETGNVKVGLTPPSGHLPCFLLKEESGGQCWSCVLGQSSGRETQCAAIWLPQNWDRTSPAGGEMRSSAGGSWAGSFYNHQVEQSQLVKMQFELSLRHYLLSVLWSWVNFLQLQQEIRKSPNEREGGSQPLFTSVRRKYGGKWIHSWAN